MSDAYPELLEASTYIQKVIINEEERFNRTLDNGLKVLDEALQELKAQGRTRLPGKVIFQLYDTYGFPVDLIQDVVRDDGLTLDMEGFQAAMEHQRVRSRRSWKGTGRWSTEAYKALSAQGIQIDFVGYKDLQYTSEILLLVKDNNEVTCAAEDDTIELVVAATPFYGEAGGQVGDRGTITGKNGKMEVLETFKDPNGIIIHKGKMVLGSIEKGETVMLSVDQESRRATALNHTATHILHTVLRRVLGDHVKQAGSFVASDRLRFDFTHFSALDDDTIWQIETLVNEEIRNNTPLTIEEMDAQAAQNEGAIALFEEKYGDRVRVVSIENFSKELCGGTHTKCTGDIGIFKILSEASIAAGIRRIEAITGKNAIEYVLQTTRTIHRLARVLKTRPNDLEDRIEQLIAKQKVLEKEIETLKERGISQESNQLAEALKIVNGIPVLAKVVTTKTPAALRDLADRASDRIKSGIIVLGCAVNSKALLVAVVTKDYLNRYNAGKIIKKIAPIVGGGGGGRPDMAQAGGNKPEQLSEALKKVYEVVAEG
jgi:alanyl-tRNA synthetase